MNVQPKKPTVEELAQQIAELRADNDGLRDQVRAVGEAGGFPQVLLDQLENLQYLKPLPLGSAVSEQVGAALANLQRSLARVRWPDVAELPVQRQDIGFIHQARPLNRGDGGPG